jgi:hypothetical protein
MIGQAKYCPTKVWNIEIFCTFYGKISHGESEEAEYKIVATVSFKHWQC